jgi:hypothetical protein
MVEKSKMKQQKGVFQEQWTKKWQFVANKVTVIYMMLNKEYNLR